MNVPTESILCRVSAEQEQLNYEAESSLINTMVLLQTKSTYFAFNYHENRRLPSIRCPDKTSVRPNVQRQNIWGLNVWRDKTSGGTKYPEGQYVGPTKLLWGQNIRRNNIHGIKCPWIQNVREGKTCGDITDNVHLGYIFIVHSRQYLLKNLLSVEEKSANSTHSL
jgi:hypothetical protein